ncbi:MAG: hypothetical protein V1747_07225 [Candidatus Omnitrophota bacterium]
MKKIFFLLMLILLFFEPIVFAADLVVSLKFARENNKKLRSIPAIPEKKEVSGTVLLDIKPYPAYTEKDKCLVKYYIDDTLVYETDGWNDANPSVLSFSYVLDTMKCANGEYALYVNYFDQDGNEAVGAARIVINNKD